MFVIIKTVNKPHSLLYVIMITLNLVDITNTQYAKLTEVDDKKH